MDTTSLTTAIRACQNCFLWQLRATDQATHLPNMAVPAKAGKNYELGGLAFMAQSPGKVENQRGEPLVGPAGKLFDELLASVGLSRDDVLLMNRVRCHPPRNRLADYPYALVECDPWTMKELELYDPSVVVLMGREALELAFSGRPLKVGETSGKLRSTIGNSEFAYGERVWCGLYHPAALLRNRALSERVEKDLRVAVDVYTKI